MKELLMNLKNLPKHFKTALINIWRNGAMTFSSIFAVTITLLLIGVIGVLALNVQDISSNIDQRNAVIAPCDKSLFIVAGPGSGKTTVMVLKLLKYIFVDDIEPNRILATTFTRKAADELYSRILGWGDTIKNHILDTTDDFNTITKIIKIDFNIIFFFKFIYITFFTVCVLILIIPILYYIMIFFF